MKTLIIDTTKNKMFVGLMNENNKYIAEVKGIGKHNETLIPTIDRLLSENNLTINQLDCVAVNIGAGSFTGIRVGVSTVKAFAIAIENLKCVSFNTLELLAYSNNVTGDYTAVISAGANNMYVAQCCDRDVISQQHNTFEEFEQTKHNRIVANLEEKDILPINNAEYVSQLKYFELIKQKQQQNMYCDANTLEPLYLRLSQAERELLEKNANKPA